MTEKQWNKMDDKKRWQWVIENQDKGYTVMLGNDDTFLQSENEDEDCFTFDCYLGWSEGITTLLDVIGIKNECV